MPGRFTAVRCPASARAAGLPCTCTLRTRSTGAPGGAGRSAASSPSAICPESSVPVTTVPKPFMEKARSMGRNTGPSAGRSVTSPASRAISARSPSSPSPVAEDTGTTAAPSRNVPFVASRTSCSRSGSQSAPSSGRRSDFVTATSPRGTPRRRQMSRCSRVWGITPSSAAMTSTTRSMPPAPAAIARTNRSWPGTSTNPATVPSGSERCANPSSMVIPRRFSSTRRSVSIPVSARTSEVLPWSMCPAVPTTTRFMCPR